MYAYFRGRTVDLGITHVDLVQCQRAETAEKRSILLKQLVLICLGTTGRYLKSLVSPRGAPLDLESRSKHYRV